MARNSIPDQPEMLTPDDADELLIWSQANARMERIDKSVLVSVTNFIDQPDTPASYSGQANKQTTVNIAENAIEFTDPQFANLTDTPSAYSGQSGKHVTVNTGETALEFTDPPAGITAFVGLADTPADYVGQGTNLVAVNSGETALEYVAPSAGGASLGCRVQLAVEYGLTTGGFQAIAFDGVVGEAWWVIGNPTRITMPSTGWYNIGFATRVYHASNAQDEVIGMIAINGDTGVNTGRLCQQQYANVASFAGYNVSVATVYYFTAGDYIEGYIYNVTAGHTVTSGPITNMYAIQHF